MLDDRDVLLAKASQEVDLRASQYRDALDALTGAHAALAQAIATRAWLARFPEVAEPRPALLIVPNLLARNGDPEKVPTVLAALRNLGELAASATPVVSDDESGVIDAREHWAQVTRGHVTTG